LKLVAPWQPNRKWAGSKISDVDTLGPSELKLATSEKTDDNWFR
jgi:hypothetical protein